MIIEVVYLEPDVYQLDDLKLGIEALIHEIGLDTHIRTYSDADMVDDACRQGECDIFVCDLTLNRGVSENYSGLQVIDRIKKRYPYVFVIGVTGGYPDLASVEMHNYSFDLFLPKTPLLRRQFNKNPDYVNRLKSRYRPLPKIIVEISGITEKPRDGDIPEKRNIDILIRQMFSSNLPFVDGLVPYRVELSPLGGGRSKSLVFKMKELPKSGMMHRTIDSVIKISPLMDSWEESSRYQKYIKWSLPYDVRVDILALAETENWGAIAYSFAHGGKNGDIKTLTDIFQAANVSDSVSIIDKVFTAASSLWTPIPNGIKQNEIPNRYYNRHFGGENGVHFTLKAMITAIRGAGLTVMLDKENMDISGRTFPNFERMLVEQSEVLGHMSLVHGDLNSNNILVGGDGGLALIDFRDAGVGHLFEDIISMEGCVRLYWSWSRRNDALASFDECLEMERTLNQKSGKIDPNSGWAVIKHIRLKAKEKFPNIDFRSYFYGLAYYCFRLMRLGGLPPECVPRLLSCFVASGEEFKRL